MLAATQTPKPSSGSLNNPQVSVRLLQQLEANTHILLLLPDDLYELYQKSLSKRITAFGINLTVAHADYPEEKLGSFDYVLHYHCPLPTTQEAPSSEGEETSTDFKVQGIPSLEKMQPFKREEDLLTELDQRFLSLQVLTSAQERDIHFQKLAQAQQNVRQKLSAVEQCQQELDQLTEQIVSIQQTYYQALKYLLLEALEKSSGLNTLGQVMKRFAKILIIDGQEQQTLDQVVALGYNRRNLTCMNHFTFHQLHAKFISHYQDTHPGEVISPKDFLLKSDVFEEYEIILYNAWHYKNDQLSIGICIKQWPLLSRKEKHQAERNPDQLTQESKNLEKSCQELQFQLKEIQAELQIAETQGGLSEQKYQVLERKRKRLLSDLKRKITRLKQLHKKISAKKEIIFYPRDLIQIIQNHQTFVQRLDEKTAHWHGLNELLSHHKSAKKGSSASDLQHMADLIQQKQKITQKRHHLNTQIKSVLKKMEHYAQQHPLSTTKSYQQTLGIHVLNCLEQQILSCSIAHLNQFIHLYPGPYFQEEGFDVSEEGDELLTHIDIDIASKTHHLPTQVLEHVFQIEEAERAARLDYSSTLPEAADFQNKEFDLLIINYHQYSTQQIFECLKQRNQSANPHIPVLILTSEHYQLDPLNKLRFDLLIGLNQDAEGNISLKTPPYLIGSLTNAVSLIPALCQVMGIPEEMIPPYLEPSEADTEEPLVPPVASQLDILPIPDQDLLPAELEETKQIVESAVTSEDETAGLPATQKETGQKIPEIPPAPEKISLALPEEEVYTVGELFAFDDEEEIAIPDKTEKETNPVENSEQKEEPVKPEDRLSEENTSSEEEEIDEVYETSHLF